MASRACAREVIDALLALLNADVLPVVPEKGSVGASGDLAPLAHLAGVLIGVGEAFVDGRRVPRRGARAPGSRRCSSARRKASRCSTARRLRPRSRSRGAARCERVFDAAVAVGAMTVDAAKGSDTPFDARIHAVRGQPGQRDVAARYRAWLAGSAIRASHLDCDTRPGPVLPALPAAGDGRLPRPDARTPAASLLREANGVSDNPLVFADDDARRCRAATSTPSRSPSRPTTWRSRSPRSARSPSAAPRC